jgi:geranylgeranyl reductase family protein
VIRCDALIVGGGPAGSTCAWALGRAGWNVVVVDRARFPRDKVCAGWLTPEVFDLLELRPEEYGATELTLQEIRSFWTGIIGGHLIETQYPRPVSYAIRRCEFDDFLLRRANVRVLEGTSVTSLGRRENVWIINDAIEAPVIVAAGGHFCPVARHLRGGGDTARPIVAKELEFRLSEREATRACEAPELFFCRDLEGYGWSVKKGQYLNVGFGRRHTPDFPSHVTDFIESLRKRGALTGTSSQWKGHAYLASGTGSRPLTGPGMVVVGDAAGLAYPESGEGIRPAIETGRLAAATLIAAGGRNDLDSLQPYEDDVRRLYPPATTLPFAGSRAGKTIGRMLLQSSVFTRHVLLDRWFLRTAVSTANKAHRQPPLFVANQRGSFSAVGAERPSE